STTRASRLPGPSATPEAALVNAAGAAMNVKIASGLSLIGVAMPRILYASGHGFSRAEGQQYHNGAVILSEGGLPRVLTSAGNPSRRILVLFSSLPQEAVILSEGGLPRVLTSAGNPSRRILVLFSSLPQEAVILS